MRVEFYTKPQCSLCEVVKDALDEVSARVRFELIEINILADESLFQRFRYAIPVVAVNGEELFRYRATAEELEAALLSRGGIPVAESPARK